MDSNDILEMLSVSSGDNVESLESVSGNDFPENTSANIYVISLIREEEKEAIPVVSEEVNYNLWNKPLEEYSVSEGLLLIAVVGLIMAFVYCFIKGGFAYLIRGGFTWKH